MGLFMRDESPAAPAALLWCKTRQSKRSLVLSALGVADKFYKIIIIIIIIIIEFVI